MLSHDLEKLVLKFSPAAAAVEKIYFGNNKKTAILTAQARGALLLTLTKHSVPTHSLTPLQIKSRLTSYGRADKQQVQSLVVKRLNLSTAPQPDDAADALAAAICLVDNKSYLSNISSNR
jgi:crossover junction endodeoxyribonuclease RuvC